MLFALHSPSGIVPLLCVFGLWILKTPFSWPTYKLFLLLSLAFFPSFLENIVLSSIISLTTIFSILFSNHMQTQFHGCCKFVKCLCQPSWCLSSLTIGTSNPLLHSPQRSHRMIHCASWVLHFILWPSHSLENLSQFK